MSRRIIPALVVLAVCLFGTTSVLANTLYLPMIGGAPVPHCAAERLHIQHTSAYGGYYHGRYTAVIGEVVNTCSIPVYDVVLGVYAPALYTGFVNVGFGRTAFHCLLPNQTVSFLIGAAAYVAGRDRIQIDSFAEASETTYALYTVVSHEQAPDNTFTRALIRNDQPHTLLTYTLVATYYDATGTVVDVEIGVSPVPQPRPPGIPPDPTHPDFPGVAPGATLEVGVDGPKRSFGPRPSYVSIVVQAEGVEQ